MRELGEQVDAVYETNVISCPCGRELWKTEGEFRLPRVGHVVLLVECACGVAVKTPHHPEWRNTNHHFGHEIRLTRRANERDDEYDDEYDY